MPVSPGGCCSCISAWICARNAALKPLTLVSVSALPFSGNIVQQPGLFPFHLPVWAGCSTVWDLRWHHSCSLQSGFVIVTENLVSLSLSNCFYSPSSQQTSRNRARTCWFLSQWWSNGTIFHETLPAKEEISAIPLILDGCRYQSPCLHESAVC